MEDLILKVKEQTEVIDKAIIQYKALLLSLEMNRRLYYGKEYRQKMTLVQSIIDMLELLRIKI